MTTLPDFYSPTDMQKMSDEQGCACGHGALAAAIDTSVFLAWTVCLKWHNKSWVSESVMRMALDLSERKWTQHPACLLPSNGVVQIQWIGPWTQPNRPRIERMRYRHWIAVRDGYVWDANLEMWVTRKVWEDWLPEIMPKNCTGWEPCSSFEIALALPAE